VELEEQLEKWQDYGDKHLASDGKFDDEYELIYGYEGAQKLKAKNTLYGALGVNLNALPEEIDAAFARLCKRYGGKEAGLNQYVAVSDAYKVLSDPEAKNEYDLSIGNSAEV